MTDDSTKKSGGVLSERVSKLARGVGGAAAGLASRAKASFVGAMDGDGDGAVGVEDVVAKARGALSGTRQAIVNALDENGNGEIDVEDVIVIALRLPGVKINREAFLRKALFESRFDKSDGGATLEIAAGAEHDRVKIDRAEIDKIADEIIQFERSCVAGISLALSVPGGLAVAATIPADIAQYYSYLLRASQKLLYLYGFPALKFAESGREPGQDVINVFTLCLGVMYEVKGASDALRAFAQALARSSESERAPTRLARETLEPIVASVSRWFKRSMTREILSELFEKAVPIVGGAIGGGVTYITFKPCCDRLKAALRSTPLNTLEEATI